MSEITEDHIEWATVDRLRDMLAFGRRLTIRHHVLKVIDG